MQPVNSATVARRRPIAGKNSGNGPSFRRGGGNISTIRRNCTGNSYVSRVACSSFIRPSPLGNPRRQQRPTQLACIRKQPKQNPAVKPIVLLRIARRPHPSPRETARSACHTARPTDTPSHTPGNRGTIPDARAPDRSAPACRRSRRASDRCARADSHSRRPFPHTSDKPTCTTRNGRSPTAARNRAQCPGLAGEFELFS